MLYDINNYLKQYLECSGIFSNIQVHSGTCKNIQKHCGKCNYISVLTATAWCNRVQLTTAGAAVVNWGQSGTNKEQQGTFWDILGWIFLDILIHFDTFWDILGHSGTFWDNLGHSGTLWDILGHSGTFWHILAHSGTFWNMQL